MPSTVIRYFRMILTELAPKDERMEVEKDIWELRKLDIPARENLIRNDLTLNFTKIPQPDIREETKKGIPEERLSGRTDTASEYPGQYRESIWTPSRLTAIFEHGYSINTADRIQDLYRLGDGSADPAATETDRRTEAENRKSGERI